MRSRLFLGICVTLLLAGIVSAAPTNFTGAINSDWFEAGNWSNRVPIDGDKARFNASDAICILDQPGAVTGAVVLEWGSGGRLRLVDGGELNVAHWTGIGYDTGDYDFVLEVLGGIYNNGGWMTAGIYGSGTLLVDYLGVVNTQTLNLGHESLVAEGYVEAKGGTINITEPLKAGDENGGWLNIAKGGPKAVGKIDFSGGQLTAIYSSAREVYIQQHIDNGNITAYDSNGVVVIETIGMDTEEPQLVVRGQHPMNPVPVDSGYILPGEVTLEWTVPAGIEVDVWFGDENTWDKIVDRQVATSKTVNVEIKKRYWWAVDIYVAGSGDPTLGPVFDFYADNIPPVIDAGADLRTWLTDGTVDVKLDGSVADVDATTSTWSVILYDANDPFTPNELLPVDANNAPPIVIADVTALDSKVTLNGLGTYVLQLDATDGEYEGIADTMTIFVSANHCLAAKAAPNWEPLPGDLNEDCIVNEEDLAILEEHWLECTSLDCP